LYGACPTTTVKGAKLGRSGGKLPTYAQAKLIGDTVKNNLLPAKFKAAQTVVKR
jgi:hypothetical protein